MCAFNIILHISLLNIRLIRLIMSLKKDDKEKIIQAAKKVMQDKKVIIAYTQGKITKKELNERGVKLAMPL